MVSFKQVGSLMVSVLVGGSMAGSLKTSAPQMGWNSYNSHACNVDENIVIENAKGLVELGLVQLGYKYVTTDCGWYNGQRDETGALEWNMTRFPSGGKGLGDKLHDIGVKFGLYSGGGFWQCLGGKKYQGSLGHERADAQAFARWGADSLKYDNCYNTPTIEADFRGPESTSPERFRAMGDEISKLDRDILYQLCQWGVGNDLGSWAAPIANSWRISVDIYHNWGSIWRITNQAIPYARHTAPGAYPDMDMLIVGLGALSQQEEQTHFSLWSIFKSPLILGNSMSEPMPKTSLDIISNKEVIAINQDPLGKSAKLVRRFSEEGYDIYSGELSGDRMVFGVTNWKNASQTVSVDLRKVLRISSAQARDIWAHKNVGRLSGTYKTTIKGHETRLLILSDVKLFGSAHRLSSYHVATNATISGNATSVQCALGQCLPAGSKVANIGIGPSNAAVTFNNVYAQAEGTKLLELDFINFDIAWETSWRRPQGSSTRNVTISVNSGTPQRWALPISGGSWFESSRLALEVHGFKSGNNTVVFGAADDLVGFAPELVGFALVEES